MRVQLGAAVCCSAHDSAGAARRRRAGCARAAQPRAAAPAVVTFDVPSRRAVLCATFTALVSATAPPHARSEGDAPVSGLELAAAVRSASDAVVALRALAASPGDAACLAAAAAALPPLREALPVVGAAAADYAAPRLDLGVAAFAFLDRAADGASLGGGNRSIGPADIERLEALEDATQAALDAAAAVEAALALPGGGEADAVACAAREAARRVEALLAELPKSARRRG